jgi:D-amino-acid dehydrogenase
MKKHIVIIGAGVIGLNCAFYLSEEGHTVTLIDRNQPIDNLNCSIGNCGMIVPSHFVPLAAPGIVAQGMKWLFNPRSPFYIRPQLNADMISWLWKFYRTANEKHVLRVSPAIKNLNSLSLDLFRELHTSEKFEFFFRKKGLLLLCKTEKTLEEEIIVSKAANKLGLETVTLDTTGLKELEPEIEINVAGGVLYPGDAHISPNQFVSKMYTYLKAKENVKFVLQSEVIAINKEKNEIKSVITASGEEIKGDEYVLAAGSFSGNLVKQLTINLPMLGGKGYSLTVQQQAEKLSTPTILCEARVAITPWDNIIRFGGTMELGGEEYKINPLRVEGIVNSINKYFPKYDCTPLLKASPWSGLRPCPPDGLPYIGRFRRTPNLIAATGHSMMGLSLAPATGKIVNAIVSGIIPEVDIAHFTPDRYH